MCKYMRLCECMYVIVRVTYGWLSMKYLTHLSSSWAVSPDNNSPLVAMVKSSCSLGFLRKPCEDLKRWEEEGFPSSPRSRQLELYRGMGLHGKVKTKRTSKSSFVRAVAQIIWEALNHPTRGRKSTAWNMLETFVMFGQAPPQCSRASTYGGAWQHERPPEMELKIKGQRGRNNGLPGTARYQILPQHGTLPFKIEGILGKSRALELA